MSKFIKLFFICANIFLTWQISRIIFGNITFFQFFIFSILIVVMVIISIFMSGRARVQVKKYTDNDKDNPFYNEEEEGFDSY